MMPGIRAFWWAQLAAVFLLSTVAAAQPAGARRPGASPHNYAHAPFDPAAEKLPPGYRGHDPFAVVASLRERKAQMTKDEFETTEQFRQRVGKLEAEPLFGGLKAESLLAFVIGDLETKYDADKETFDITANACNIPGGIKYVNTSDAEGASACALRETLKMDIPTARRAKQSLQALAVVALRSPYYAETGFRRGLLVADLREIWLYDSATGQVFKKTRLQDLMAQLEEAKRAAAEAEKDKVRTARQLFESGQDDEALAELNRVLLVEPMSPEAHLLIGRIYQRRGDLVRAVSSLKTAIFWDAGMIDAHILLARILFVRNDLAQAGSHIRAALAIDPNNQEAINLSRQIFRTGK